jgi:hypothetical protein
MAWMDIVPAGKTASFQSARTAVSEVLVWPLANKEAMNGCAIVRTGNVYIDSAAVMAVYAFIGLICQLTRNSRYTTPM